ncbi:MAG: hypothetical protein KIT84_02455 [Labilithrix sp.]|nr:hypothetical protein [Labilithrix sp.]MCW5809847.1 hypothetical protein [Labilithrix sp.]
MIDPKSRGSGAVDPESRGSGAVGPESKSLGSRAVDPKSESLGSRALEGNGAGLVREIALASRIQRGLENLYRLDRSANVDDYVAEAGEGERESLLVREHEGALELCLRLPRLEAGELDPVCQIIEGVSHFVYLADRAAQDRATTQLELELQAEVDKYVVLASSLDGFDAASSRRLRARLYERVAFTHERGTALGERYRIANERAHRFTGRLERELVAPRRFEQLRAELRRFFHMSQSDKLRAA